jgi:hypothetical protein
MSAASFAFSNACTAVAAASPSPLICALASAASRDKPSFIAAATNWALTRSFSCSATELPTDCAEALVVSPRLLRGPGNALIELHRHARRGGLLRQRDIFVEPGIAKIPGLPDQFEAVEDHKRVAEQPQDRIEPAPAMIGLNASIQAPADFRPVPSTASAGTVVSIAPPSRMMPVKIFGRVAQNAGYAST